MATGSEVIVWSRKCDGTWLSGYAWARPLAEAALLRSSVLVAELCPDGDLPPLCEPTLRNSQSNDVTTGVV